MQKLKIYSLPSLNDPTVVSAIIQHHGRLCVGSNGQVAVGTVYCSDQRAGAAA